AGVADAAAAIDHRIGVYALAVAPRTRHADPVIVARHRREIADDDREFAGLAAAPDVGENALGAVGGVDPREPFGVAIELIKRWGRAVEPVQIAHERLHPRVKR